MKPRSPTSFAAVSRRRRRELPLILALLAPIFFATGCYGASYGTSGYVGVSTAPPPPSNVYYEYQDNGVWIEGRWIWASNSWQWRPGYWVTARPGYVYSQGYWYQDQNMWLWYPGRWLQQRPGYVWMHGYWDSGLWIRGRWAPQRRGQYYQRGRWMVTDHNRRVWQPPSWRRGTAVRDSAYQQPRSFAPSSQRSGRSREGSGWRSYRDRDR